MHVLAQARAAAVAALTGLPTTGVNVYTQEAYPWQPEQLPALLVSVDSRPTADTLDWPSDVQWDITLQVVAILRGLPNLADAADVIATEVQAALCALPDVGGKPVSVVPSSFDAPQFSGDGDQPVARRLMTFEIVGLATNAADPDTLI